MNRGVAHLLLIAAAMCWGFGNVIQKTVLDHVGPLGAVGGRCLLAVLVLAPLLLLERRLPTSPGFLRSAVGVATLFAGAMGLQQAAYQWTSVTNAGILVNACTVLTPIAAWLAFGRAPGLLVAGAAGATLWGAYLMAGGGSLSDLNPGDLACFGSAVLYAGWYVALEHHAVRHGRPIATTVVQFSCAATLFLPAAIGLEPMPAGDLPAAAAQLLVLGVLATAAPFVLLTIAQRHATATTTAVIASAEGVFGAAAAFVLLGERVPPIALAGAAVMIAAIVAVAAERELNTVMWRTRRRFLAAV